MAISQQTVSMLALSGHSISKSQAPSSEASQHCVTLTRWLAAYALQVYIGRQHHLAIEVAGQQYELVLNNQLGQDAAGAGAAAAGPAAAPKQKALPMPVSLQELCFCVVLTHQATSRSVCVRPRVPQLLWRQASCCCC
jgi:hypothetical protein